MTVESNNWAIVIAMLREWLKTLLLVFQAMRSKTKTNHTLPTLLFSHALSKLELNFKNSDWFIRLFPPVMIGQSI